MKEKKVYKRSFKNLVYIFLILAMFIFNNGINCMAVYSGIVGMNIKFCAALAIEIVANVIASETLTYIALSGFNKYPSEDIMAKKKNRITFAVATALLAAVFTIINIFCMCCMMYYGKCC